MDTNREWETKDGVSVSIINCFVRVLRYHTVNETQRNRTTLGGVVDGGRWFFRKTFGFI